MRHSRPHLRTRTRKYAPRDGVFTSLALAFRGGWRACRAREDITTQGKPNKPHRRPLGLSPGVVDGMKARGQHVWLVQIDASSALPSPVNPCKVGTAQPSVAFGNLVSVNQSMFTLFPILQRRLHGIWVLHLRASARIYVRLLCGSQCPKPPDALP